MSSEPTAVQGGISRRGAICGLLLASLGVAMDFAPDAAQAAAGITTTKDGKLQVSLAANKALAKVGGSVIVGLNDGSELAVVRVAPGVKGFVALSLTCPHNGATVMQQGNDWICPAHGSEFTLSGKLLRGPARQALSTYPLAATAKTLTIG
jgi:cytochrome b6-f complex iron-sulfur subunit